MCVLYFLKGLPFATSLHIIVETFKSLNVLNLPFNCKNICSSGAFSMVNAVQICSSDIP